MYALLPLSTLLGKCRMQLMCVVHCSLMPESKGPGLGSGDWTAGVDTWTQTLMEVDIAPETKPYPCHHQYLLHIIIDVSFVVSLVSRYMQLVASSYSTSQVQACRHNPLRNWKILGSTYISPGWSVKRGRFDCWYWIFHKILPNQAIHWLRVVTLFAGWRSPAQSQLQYGIPPKAKKIHWSIHHQDSKHTSSRNEIGLVGTKKRSTWKGWTSAISNQKCITCICWVHTRTFPTI